MRWPLEKVWKELNGLSRRQRPFQPFDSAANGLLQRQKKCWNKDLVYSESRLMLSLVDVITRLM
jgi:hypothetical protein